MMTFKHSCTLSVNALERFVGTFGLLGLLASAACVTTVVPATVENERSAEAGLASSIYVPMRDGVELAVDVFRASSFEAPTILVTTRYGRPSEQNAEIIDLFASHGFHFVFADARGTGASFGERPIEFSPDETKDIGELIDWIANQSWSNGQVVVTGNSYSGDTADLATSTGRPALRAAVVRHSEFDVFRHLIAPGGVRNAMMLDAWGVYVRALDLSEPCLSAAHVCSELDHLRAVDDDPQYKQLRAALKDRASNFHPGLDLTTLAFVDDVTQGGIPVSVMSAASYIDEIRSAGVPVQYWGSWLDAGTAASGLARYNAIPEAPMELYLAAWSHGGGMGVDPFRPEKQANPIDRVEQFQIQARFLSKAIKNPQELERIIHYLPMGGEHWRETDVWPPPDIELQRYWLGPDDSLTLSPPSDIADVSETYTVQFQAGTGSHTRWHTQLGGGPVRYGDLGATGNYLTFETEPMTSDMEMSGSVGLDFYVNASREDGALFVYFEAVSPTGEAYYLTEGQHRLIHRTRMQRSSSRAPLQSTLKRADAQPMPVGTYQRVQFTSFPLSAKIPESYRLRLSIGGHDRDVFSRYPADGSLELQISRDRARPSSVTIPLKTWKEARLN